MKKLIAIISLLLFVFTAVGAPPYVRNQFDTNDDVTVSALITNIALSIGGATNGITSVTATNIVNAAIGNSSDGQTIYVAPWGNDTNGTGTINKPFRTVWDLLEITNKTFRGAATVAQSGDTIALTPDVHHLAIIPRMAGVNIWVQPGATVIRTNFANATYAGVSSNVTVALTTFGPLIQPGNNSACDWQGATIIDTNDSVWGAVYGWNASASAGLAYGITNDSATNTVVYAGNAEGSSDVFYFAKGNTQWVTNWIFGGSFLSHWDQIYLVTNTVVNTFGCDFRSDGANLSGISRGVWNVGGIWNDHKSSIRAEGGGSSNIGAQIDEGSATFDDTAIDRIGSGYDLTSSGAGTWAGTVILSKTNQVNIGGQYTGNANALTNLPLIGLRTNTATVGQVPTFQGGNVTWSNVAAASSVLTNIEDTATGVQLVDQSAVLEDGVLTVGSAASGDVGEVVVKDSLGATTIDLFGGTGIASANYFVAALGLIGNGSGVSNAVDIIAGSNITVTTNADKRSFTIASTASGSGGIAINAPVAGYVLGNNGTTNLYTNSVGPLTIVTNNPANPALTVNGNETVNGEITAYGGSGVLKIGSSTSARLWFQGSGSVASVSAIDAMSLELRTSNTKRAEYSADGTTADYYSASSRFNGSIISSNNAAASNPFVRAQTNGNLTALSFSTPTNHAAAVPDFTKSAQLYATNAAYVLLPPSGVSSNNYESITYFVVGSDIPIITTSSGVNSSNIYGTAYCTNRTRITIDHYGYLFTNIWLVPEY